ncbi:MAG: hypothetical protein IPF54_20405 [Draconibacterium sp.]|nr:hypothetical protein [Draconibacterium sp.]
MKRFVPGGDIGISDLNTQTWSPSNPFLTAVYQRLGLSITYANDFIRLTADNPDLVKYNAEARFLCTGLLLVYRPFWKSTIYNRRRWSWQILSKTDSAC